MTDFLKQGVTSNLAFAALHITDFHARIDAPEYANSQARIPLFLAAMGKEDFDLVIDSGDTLEGNMFSRGTVTEQLAIYQPVIDFIDGREKPRYNTLGNHDIINNDVNEVLTALGMPSNYYYVDVSGTNWRLIFLDSTVTGSNGNGPYGLGTTQLTWLTDLLAASTSKLVCIISHVPVLSAGMAHWYAIQNGSNPITVGAFNLTMATHVDLVPILALLRQYSNVKAWLSGHGHQWDDMKINQMECRFLSCGAVSGYYWDLSNNWHHGYAGFRKLYFFNDGSIDFKNILF